MVFWYKEKDGKRICSLSGDVLGDCDITFLVIDLSPLNWLVDKPDCKELLDELELAERLAMGETDDDNDVDDEPLSLIFTRSDIEAFCKQRDIHTIMSLLTSLGIPPERIEIRNSLLSEEDYKTLEEKGVQGLDVPNIITFVEANALGLSISLEELWGLNKLMQGALNSNRKIAIVEFIFEPTDLDDDVEEKTRHYWVVIEKPKPRVEFVAEEETEELGNQESKEHEGQKEEQGE
jgi:hypothetical protein